MERLSFMAKPTSTNGARYDNNSAAYCEDAGVRACRPPAARGGRGAAARSASGGWDKMRAWYREGADAMDWET